jgi:hypothetical protein
MAVSRGPYNTAHIVMPNHRCGRAMSHKRLDLRRLILERGGGGEEDSSHLHEAKVMHMIQVLSKVGN